MQSLLSDAQRFLTALDPHNDKFVFLAIDEWGIKKKPIPRYGALEGDCLRLLLQRNADGYGVFVTVNETRNANRKSEDVTRVRAVWCDEDKPHEREFPLTPSLVVNTSPRKHHYYWLIKDTWECDLSGVWDFEAVMGRIVADYGGDPNARDLARVMRLPGFNHVKGEPFPVRIVSDSGLRYTREEIVRAFPPLTMPPKPKATSLDVTQEHTPEQAAWETEKPRIEEAVAVIPSDEREDWLTVGMAIHDASGGTLDGFKVWDTWSRTSRKYDKQDQWRTWKGFHGERSNPKTVASLYALAKEYGARTCGGIEVRELSERPTVQLRQEPNPDELTERTMVAVQEKFEGYGHSPSDEQYDGLKQIALVIEAMADNQKGLRSVDGERMGLRPNLFVSFLPPGTGKTTVLIEAVKTLQAMEVYDDVGVIVFLSRLEEISKLVAEMGLKYSEYAVIVSEGKAENKLGRQDDKTLARVLFTTQEGLRTRGRDGKSFGDMPALFYRGKPRSVRVWDEAILPSKELTVGRYDISSMFKTLQQWRQRELADELENFFSYLKGVKDRETVSVPDIERYGIDFEEARNWFEAEHKDPVEALFKLSGKDVRVRKNEGGNAVLDYEDILPDDLAPMLILDASGQQRETYQYWYEDRKGLKFLPSPGKRYDGFTIHHWDKGAGKKAHNKDSKTLAEGVAKTINQDVPSDEEVLVVHFKPNRYIPDMEREIRKQLTGNVERVRFVTWGKHTATNEFCHVKYVILAGILQYGVPQNEAIGRGAKGIRTEDEFSQDDFDGTRLGEIAHNIFQAACRGHVRNSVDGMCPTGCHLYVIFSTRKDNGIPVRLLDRIFPGAEVVPWKPVYSLTGKNKTLVELLESGITAKAELTERLGIIPNNLSRYLNDRNVREYLEDEGYTLTIRQNEVELAGPKRRTTVPYKGRKGKHRPDYDWDNMPF